MVRRPAPILATAAAVSAFAGCVMPLRYSSDPKHLPHVSVLTPAVDPLGPVAVFVAAVGVLIAGLAAWGSWRGRRPIGLAISGAVYWALLTALIPRPVLMWDGYDPVSKRPIGGDVTTWVGPGTFFWAGAAILLLGAAVALRRGRGGTGAHAPVPAADD